MAVTRANVEATKAFIRARIGNPYVYGGALSADVRQGTDCSEVWQTVLEMVHGRWKPGRQSEGATTESYRYIPVGGVGPFGTIRVASWRDIPANAAAKLAFHHAGNGGAAAHMWGELDGMRIESASNPKGLCTAPKALAVDNSYANAWAYLPGPIEGAAGDLPTLGVGSTGADVIRVQARLNEDGAGLEVDGEYGPLTAAAVSAFQQRAKVTGDPAGVVGQATWKALNIATPQPTGGLTAEVLARVMDNRLSLARYRELLPLFVQFCRDVGAHTIERRAMIVAQLGHESGGLVHKREIADGSAYEGRADLGNTQPGDGRRFRGRGFIQLTGRDHAAGVSRWAHNLGLVPTPTYFVDRPELMETDANAFLVSRYYWTVSRPQLNTLADRRDLIGATRAVNGGTNGLDDRRKFYDRALAAGADLLDPIETDPIEELLMQELESWSIYATPGEPKIPATRMLQAIDAANHRELVENAARMGDTESLARIARTAKGLGKYTDEATKEHAIAVLADIGGKTKDQVREILKG